MNLKRCQRYYFKQLLTFFNCGRYNHTSGPSLADFYFPTEMRANPTASTSGTFVSSAGYTGTPGFGGLRTTAFYLSGPSISANQMEYVGGSDAYIIGDAEL